LSMSSFYRRPWFAIVGRLLPLLRRIFPSIRIASAPSLF
jgi:hypothetical protein